MSTHNLKITEIFKELAGERANRLRSSFFPADIASRIASGILSEHDSPSEQDVLTADDVGFHLVDWQSDAAFLVALTLFPERFTDEEVAEGVRAFLIHVPAHVAEAARVGGYSVENYFADDS